MLRQPFLLLILLVHVGAHLRAADQGPVFPAERCVFFTCLSWDDEIETLYYRTLTEDPKAPVQPRAFIVGTKDIGIASSFRSEPQSYLGPAVLEFISAGTPLKAFPEKPDKEPVARVLIPPDQSHLLLLFFAQKNTVARAGSQYRIEIIPDHLDDLPAGGYCLMNTTGKNLIGSMGKKSFELPAHATKSLLPPEDTAENLEWLFWNELRKEKPLYSSIWQHRPDGRTLIIITESTEQREALSIKAVQDTVHPVRVKIEPPSIPR
ncbi:hypothetical protein BH11VER1_BH11VER1_17990 [soil metagenome]